MTIIHSGRHVVIPALAGVRVFTSRGAAAAVSWWLVAGKTCVAAYQPKGAASLAASYVNLANPGTYDAAPGSAPTFDTLVGWTFNGSSQYLLTGLTPTTNTTWTALACFANVTQSGARSILGCQKDGGGTPYFYLAPYYYADQAGYGNGNELALAGALTSGTMGFAGNKAYKNGTPQTGTIGTKTGTPVDVTIGAKSFRESGAERQEYFAGDIIALCIYSATLTDAEVATVSTAMAAL